MDVRLYKTNWTDDAERMLSLAMPGNPSYTVGELKKEVAEGKTVLFRGEIDGQHAGYLTVFFEDYGGGREMVVSAGASVGKDGRALQIFMPKLRQLMLQGQAQTMRAHLTNPALMRAFERAGWEKAETVYRWDR